MATPSPGVLAGGTHAVCLASMIQPKSEAVLPPPPEATNTGIVEQSVENMKAAGLATVDGAVFVGKMSLEGAKAVGSATVDGAVFVGKMSLDGAKAVGEGVKATGGLLVTGLEKTFELLGLTAGFQSVFGEDIDKSDAGLEAAFAKVDTGRRGKINATQMKAYLLSVYDNGLDELTIGEMIMTARIGRLSHKDSEIGLNEFKIITRAGPPKVEGGLYGAVDAGFGATVGGVKAIGDGAVLMSKQSVEGFKAAGAATVDGAKAVGTVIVDGTKAVGSATMDGAVFVGKMSLDGAKAVGEGVKATGGLLATGLEKTFDHEAARCRAGVQAGPGESSDKKLDPQTGSMLSRNWHPNLADSKTCVDDTDRVQDLTKDRGRVGVRPRRRSGAIQMGQTASAGRNDVEVVFLDDDIVYGDDDRDVPLGREPCEGGELQFRDYYVGFWSRVLGKGSFATVKLATNRLTGHQVAVKIIKRKTRPSAAASEEELLQREIKHHNLLRHDNIVRLYTWVTTPKEFLLVMEFCTGGDMLRYINECQDLRTSEARYFFAQLLEGVAFCHSLGIGHRDLKLENLMLCESALSAPGAGGGASGGAGAPPAAAPASSVDAAAERPSWEGWTLKITDFGLSDLNPIGVLSTTCCGSPLYAAPELVGIGPLEGFDASKSDMWSCGVILYAFLTSRLPFDGDDMRMLVRNITRCQYEPMPAERGRAASELVAGLLALPPAHRLSARAALGSVWIAPLTAPPADAPKGASLAGRIVSLHASLPVPPSSSLPATASPRHAPLQPLTTVDVQADGAAPSDGAGAPSTEITTETLVPAPELSDSLSHSDGGMMLNDFSSAGLVGAETALSPSASLRSASATSSYFQAFYEQLHAQAYATGDVACALTQSPSYFGLTEAELKEIMAESAEESLDENYRQIMSFVEAA